MVHKINKLIALNKKNNKINVKKTYYPKKPRFLQFFYIDKTYTISTAAYLREDYNKTSQEFKNAFHRYQNAVESFKMVSNIRNDISRSKINLEIISSECRFLRLEREEKIKRYSCLEVEKILKEYNDKINTSTKNCAVKEL